MSSADKSPTFLSTNSFTQPQWDESQFSKSATSTKQKDTRIPTNEHLQKRTSLVLKTSQKSIKIPKTVKNSPILKNFSAKPEVHTSPF